MAAIHKHPVYDTDLHLIIDPVTRNIDNTSSKYVLMQNDHDSERFTFELPRYIEGHDMTLCNVVEAHYININSSNNTEQSMGVYPVTDTQLSPETDDVVIGSWLVSRNATVYAGSLNFIFRFACVDETTSEITYQWFSDIYTGVKVSRGIYNTDFLTGENDPDILAAWKKEVIEAAQESAKILTDEIKKLLDEVNQNIADYNEKIEGTVFTPNFETGELEYVSPDYVFVVNEGTGNLEWSTNKKELEDKINGLFTTGMDERFTDIEDEINNVKDQIKDLNTGQTSGGAQIAFGGTEPETANTLWFKTTTT